MIKEQIAPLRIATVLGIMQNSSSENFALFRDGNELIRLTAETLSELEHQSEYSKSDQKLYMGSMLIIERLAKHHNVNPLKFKQILQDSGLFELKKIRIKSGLFGLRSKEVTGAQWANRDMLRKRYLRNPKKLIEYACTSRALMDKVNPIIEESLVKLTPEKRLQDVRSTYVQPKIDRRILYETCLPGVFEKYEREAKAFPKPALNYYRQVAKGSEFRFRDGGIANNIISWAKCLYAAEPEVIWYHLSTHDFENWLRAKAHSRDLAAVVRSVADKFALEDVPNLLSVKSTLIDALNRTPLSEYIHEYIVTPLIKKLSTADAGGVHEAVEKLIGIKDERIVEPLIGRLFESTPETRRSIITALGKIGDKRAVSPLIKIMLYSSDDSDRIAAIKALGIIKDSRSIEALLKISKLPDLVGDEARKVLAESFGEKTAIR